MLRHGSRAVLAICRGCSGPGTCKSGRLLAAATWPAFPPCNRPYIDARRRTPIRRIAGNHRNWRKAPARQYSRGRNLASPSDNEVEAPPTINSHRSLVDIIWWRSAKKLMEEHPGRGARKSGAAGSAWPGCSSGLKNRGCPNVTGQKPAETHILLGWGSRLGKAQRWTRSQKRSTETHDTAGIAGKIHRPGMRHRRH
jgi:hypothetical protein